MMPINSKSYPYLAVAQRSVGGLNRYEEFLNLYTLEEIYKIQEGIAIRKYQYHLDNQYAREVWNAAIEEAASQVDSCGYVSIEKLKELKISVNSG